MTMRRPLRFVLRAAPDAFTLVLDPAPAPALLPNAPAASISACSARNSSSTSS